MRVDFQYIWAPSALKKETYITIKKSLLMQEKYIKILLCLQKSNFLST